MQGGNLDRYDSRRGVCDVKIKLTLAVSFGALFLCVTSAHATTIVRGASSYGPDTGFSPCATEVADFASDPSEDTCIGVQEASFTDDIGGTNYLVYQYAFVGDGTAAILDVVNVGSLAAGTVFDLPLGDNTLPTGVFSCANGTNFFAIDSGMSPLSVPCTPANFANPADIGQTPVSGAMQFTLLTGVPDLTFFTADGNLSGGDTVPTPEPSSLLLLGTGLAVLVVLRQRKSAA
jgi:hypothetical protein